MRSRLFDRATPAAPPFPVPGETRSRAGTPFDSLRRLASLAADLATAAGSTRTRWKEPRLFFFDPRRQAELEAARPPGPPAAPHAELSARISRELVALFASSELRHAARATPGLRAAAGAMAAACPAAGELAALLDVPDDEVVAVLHPGLRTGFRVAVSGVADVGQFHVLMSDALASPIANGLLADVARMPERFVAACRDVNPRSAGGGPMVVEAPFQMYAPAALAPNGELPQGFGGCEHWLWPNHALASVPRVGRERVILLGPPAYRATWEVSRRFPAMAAEARVVEVLNPFLVAGRFGPRWADTRRCA